MNSAREQQAASYIFFIENSTYYAQDGSNGQTLSDSNFTNLFLTCENNLPADGGLVFLKSGDYYGRARRYELLLSMSA